MTQTKGKTESPGTATKPPAGKNEKELAVQKAQLSTLTDLFEKRKGQFASVLPKYMSAERTIKIALSAISRNRRLMQCTTTSVLQSVMIASQLGLEAGGPLGHAYLVPYFNKNINQYECQLIPGYRGLIDLAKRSGEVSSIASHVVHEKDQFEYSYGIENRLIHVPSMDADPGPMVCVYAVAKFKDGSDPQFHVMSKVEVNKIRNRSKAKDDGPWKTDEEEMMRKTPVRNLSKYLKLSPEFATAFELESRAESDASRDIGDLIDPETKKLVPELTAEPVTMPTRESEKKNATEHPAEPSSEEKPTEETPTASIQKAISLITSISGREPLNVLEEFSREDGIAGTKRVARSIQEIVKDPAWFNSTLTRMNKSIAESRPPE